jgi:putative transposase
VASRAYLQPVAPSLVSPQPAPAQVEMWLSAAEIAEAALPGLPRVKRLVSERAEAEGWALKVDAKRQPLARKRAARGGGIEYHVSVLPAAARAKIMAKSISVPTPAPQRGDGNLWTWFDNQTTKTKDEAAERLARITDIEMLEAAGMTRSAALSTVATQYGISQSTLWNWIALIAGIAAENRLPHLAPRRQGGGKEREIDQQLWTIILSDYLRPEAPTWASCYNRLNELYAAPNGIDLPISRTLWRKFEREVDPLVAVKRRKGREAHERTMPAQVRSVADLHAMELVNIDGHRWDVFVMMPDGKIIRPMMVAIQDVYSRKLLAWRLDETENSVTTRLVFADLFKTWGIPKGCLLDNGRAFASKWITGGAKTRFRFKIKPDDPTGLLPALGVNPHWATPYHGQAKPIERMFGDFCRDVAKHPAFKGAWTGNNPMAKPENYRETAIPLETFRAVIEQNFALHNARQGRRTEMAAGRSYDDAFNESYAVAAIGKATPEQLRLALLTADDKIRTDRNSGMIMVHGNRYWAEPLSQIAGDRVVVRFDPDNLHSEIYVYDREGRFICTAPVWEKAGFLNVDAAAALARKRSDWRKKTKASEAALDLLTAAHLSELYAVDARQDADIPEPSVIRPVRHRGQTAAALRPVLDADERPLSGPRATPEPSTIDRIGRLRLVE